MRELTKPNDIVGEGKDKVIDLIENEFINYTYDPLYHKENYIDIIISGEPSIEMRNKIVDDYVKKGWVSVSHKTSSENGERGGLTSFKFYFK